MFVSLNLDQHGLPKALSKEAQFLEDHVSRIAKVLKGSRRIAVVTGAGISVAAGIPDFRSADGLYSRVLATADNKSFGSSVKGKDFFDASFFHNQSTRPLFYRFVAELCDMSTQGTPTRTHTYIRDLFDSGKLMRWYTQNIDGLEKAVGLTTTSCSVATASTTSAAAAASKSCPVVTLHGSLSRMVCTLCRSSREISTEHYKIMADGESPECDRCSEFAANRVACGKRQVRTGIMRPDIVLYNEPHPDGDVIAQYISMDISKRPQILLVMGTSLKVVGLKKLVKDLAKAVHEVPNGLVLFVNKTAAPRAEWKDVFDYELLGDCDGWIERLHQASTCRPTSSKTRSAKSKDGKKDGRIDLLFRASRRNVFSDAAKIEKSASKGIVADFGKDEKDEMSAIAAANGSIPNFSTSNGRSFRARS